VATDLVCKFVEATGKFCMKMAGVEIVAKVEFVVEKYYVSNETCFATVCSAISVIMTGLQVQ
jgi:hypothetical protein